MAPIQRRARLACAMGIRPVDGGDEPGVLYVVAHDPAGYRRGAGIYWAVGVGDLWFASPCRFCLGRTGGCRACPVATAAWADAATRSGRRDVCTGCGRGLGTVYRAWKEGRSRLRRGRGDIGNVDRRLAGDSIWRRTCGQRAAVAYAVALCTGCRGAQLGAAVFTGDDGADPAACTYLQHLVEPGACHRRSGWCGVAG